RRPTTTTRDTIALLKGAIRCAIFLAIAATLLGSSAFAATTIAVPAVQAPKKSGADKIGRTIRSRLQQEGLQVVSEQKLQAAAKRTNADPASAKAAQQAGADLLL